MAAEPCPSCGVPVTTGYTRCPRCHAVLPGGEAAQRVAGSPAGVGGGTSAEAVPGLPGGGGAARWWIGGLVAVGVGLAVVVARCGSGGGGGGGGGTGDDGRLRAAPVEPTGDQPASGTAPSGTVARRPTLTPGPDPVQLIDAMERTLAAERVYASIERDDESVELRSRSCGEPALTAVVDRFASELRAAGVRTVRCVELHGAPVFTRDL